MRTAILTPCCKSHAVPAAARSRLPSRCAAVAIFCAAVLAATGSRATETENHGIRVLPAPGPVAIDGKADDWDLSGGIFACGETEHLRDAYAVWIHAMYDSNYLYILARWNDDTPLNNPETKGGHGFNGDCLQVRFILFPDSDDRSCTWWDFSRDARGVSVMIRETPGARDGWRDNSMKPLSDASEQGAKQAFKINADGKGYVQEIAIPWKALSKSGAAPQPGSRFRMTVEPNFTAGKYGRITIKDIFDDKIVSPERIFTFRAFNQWGWATLLEKGNVEPQPVRLADSRTFKVTMRDGVPVVDWTGLIHKFEWPGFMPVTFDMPFDGYVSLNIVDSRGKIVRHLLNWDGRSAGKQIVQWDGLTDAVYRTPGQPVEPGTYRYSAIAHPGAKITFRGFACYGGRAPGCPAPAMTGWAITAFPPPLWPRAITSTWPATGRKAENICCAPTCKGTSSGAFRTPAAATTPSTSPSMAGSCSSFTPPTPAPAGAPSC